MIEIRYQTFITHGNESYCALEAFIVAFQFLFGSSKDGVVPMAKNRITNHNARIANKIHLPAG